MLLDEALPRWHHRERHRIATEPPPESLFAAFDELTWGEVPVFRALMRVRGLGRDGLPGDARIVDWFTSAGFAEVGRTTDELLIVAVERTRRGAARFDRPSLRTFRDDREPGHVKIAFDAGCADGLLSTETRVLSTDPRSRLLFAAYWLAIRAGSGIIRRVWLRAIRDRALRHHADAGETR